MKYSKRSAIGILGLGLVLLALPTTAHAVIIECGWDYFSTIPGQYTATGISGTYIDLGAFLGGPSMDVLLKGTPSGPGGSDTAVRRIEDSADLVNPGDHDAVPIQVENLALESIDPVSLFGGLYDMYVTLDTGTPSLGSMEIYLGDPPADPSEPMGTFDSFFDIWFEISLVDVTNPSNVIPIDPGVPLSMQSSGSEWTDTPQFNSIVVPGLVGEDGVNLHTDLPAGYDDFFVMGHITEQHPFAQHEVPEPISMVMLGCLAAGMTAARKLRRKK